jgi:hypothetical protein
MRECRRKSNLKEAVRCRAHLSAVAMFGAARLSQPTMLNVMDTQSRWKFRDLLRLGQPRSANFQEVQYA